MFKETEISASFLFIKYKIVISFHTHAWQINSFNYTTKAFFLLINRIISVTIVYIQLEIEIRAPLLNKNLLLLIRLALKKTGVSSLINSLFCLADFHIGDCLSLRVLSVGHSVSDHILQEHLDHTPHLFVDKPLKTLDSGESTDGWLGDALDVIAPNFLKPFPPLPRPDIVKSYLSVFLFIHNNSTRTKTSCHIRTAAYICLFKCLIFLCFNSIF